MTKPKISYVATTLFATAAVLVWVFIYGGSVATALDIDFDFYEDTAHGSSSDGADRSGSGYARGDCAQCHDTFDDSVCTNPLMLFATDNPDSQTNNFCFECHKSDGVAQQVTNNDYSATFGGGTPMFTSIYEAFNPLGTYASAHDLATIKTWVRNRGAWEPDTWITDQTNACLMCHSPHFAQKNFPVEASGYGGVKTAIRRADKVKNLGSGQDDTHMLWGDESVAAGNVKEIISERWQSTVVYQAPLRGDSGYEPGPAGSDVTTGSNLPDYVWFCAYQCHRRTSIAGIQPVNWSVDGDTAWNGYPSAHGRKAAEPWPDPPWSDGKGNHPWGVLKPPYGNGVDSDNRGQFMLSCTDCHESHGSTNPSLLRTTVNGYSGEDGQGIDTGGPGDTSGGGYWFYFCESCHELEFHYDENDPLYFLGHIMAFPQYRCGAEVGCHMSDGDPDVYPYNGDGSGGNHGFYF